MPKGVRVRISPVAPNYKPELYRRAGGRKTTPDFESGGSHYATPAYKFGSTMSAKNDIKRLVEAAMKTRPWFIDDSFAYRDINREVVKPGGSVDNTFYPDGATIFRVDGDFFTVAYLPYELSFYDAGAVIAQCFPGKELLLRPDSHSDIDHELDELYTETKRSREALMDGCQYWPVKIINVEALAATFRSVVTFENYIDNIEYSATVWNETLIGIKAGEQYILVGRYTDTGMHVEYFHSGHGSYHFTNEAGVGFNWKF